MNKSDLINEIQLRAKDVSLHKNEIASVLAALAEIVSKELAEGAEGANITLPGLGTLYKQHRPARKGRNPQTGESIEIAAKNVIDFRPTKALKDAINGD
jgi:DNA-binding protein HU-beta